MSSFNLLEIVLLVAINLCNILTHPINSGRSQFLREFDKPISLGSALLGSEYSPMAEIKSEKQAKPECLGELQKPRIVFPLKYHFDDQLMDHVPDNNLNIVNLPVVHQPYENYKVLIATAPPGLELDEDSSKAMTVYIVFNDDDRSPSPMNLPAVYFVKKRTKTNDLNELNPILLIDNNRTVTNLRSKEIQKFVKFRNKFTRRVFNDHSAEISDVLEAI